MSVSPQRASIVKHSARNAIDPALKSRGFARKGHVWVRPAPALVHVVELQASSFNERLSGAVTVNVGVSVPVAYEAVWGRPAPDYPQDADCVVRVRIDDLEAEGRLSVHPRDQWWDFEPDTDVLRLGGEIVRAILTRGLPFLDAFHDLGEVAAFLIDHPGLSHPEPLERLYAAVILNRLGRKREAAELAGSVASEHDAWGERARATVLRSGI